MSWIDSCSFIYLFFLSSKTWLEQVENRFLRKHGSIWERFPSNFSLRCTFLCRVMHDRPTQLSFEQAYTIQNVYMCIKIQKKSNYNHRFFITFTKSKSKITESLCSGLDSHRLPIREPVVLPKKEKKMKD